VISCAEKEGKTEDSVVHDFYPWDISMFNSGNDFIQWFANYYCFIKIVSFF
jgi:hypothetical protein